jgi:hypothetical protein
MLLSGATTADVPLAALSLPPPKAVVWADVRETPARDDEEERRLGLLLLGKGAV